VLAQELVASEVSGKSFRQDERATSDVSGKSGHRTEFLECAETRVLMAAAEADRCEVTGKAVRPGVLRECHMTGKRVLPSELFTCMVTGKRAVKSLFETSSVSQGRVLKERAIRSMLGRFCAPGEAQTCIWSGKKHHPDDMSTCTLTGVNMSREFAATDGVTCLGPLKELLDGMRRTEDEKVLWEIASRRVEADHGGKIHVESAVKSGDGSYLALCCVSKTLFGLRSAHVGALYDLRDGTILGKIAVGKRDKNFWIAKA
jgi:hypothetical protein